MVDLGIVMPVYKQKPEFLKAALDSVLNQTFTAFKLIIVIDGAPEMQPLAQSLVGQDPRVHIISYEVNQGVPHALNTGFAELFKEEQIKYFTWVSSDNVYRPPFLEILRSALIRGPQELGLVYSSFQSIDNNSVPLKDELALGALRKFQAKPKEALLDSSIIGVSFMYKAEYARKVIGGYSLAPVEDYDYWLKLTDHCDIKYIPVELMDYRVDSTFSVSAQLKTIEAHRQWRYAYHFTRYQGRLRRAIAPQITFLLPIQEASQQAVARIEDLYDQVFSNYICQVIDLSPDEQVNMVLKQIPHPCSAFEWLPNWQALPAALSVARSITTPYAMLLDLQHFHHVMEVQILYDQLHKQADSVFSSFYNSDQTDVYYRNEHVLAPMQTHELFRTPTLVRLLEKVVLEMGDQL